MAAALVQTKSAFVNTTVQVNTVSWNTPATAGNVLFILISSEATSATPSGYTLSTGCNQAAGLGHYLWWKIAAGGETSTTYTLSSAEISVWITAEVSGLTASPYDVSSGQNAAGTSNTYTTTTLTPTAGDRYLVASIAGKNQSSQTTTLSTWTNSYTEENDISCTSGVIRDIDSYADRAVTATGSSTYSTGATFSNSNVGDRSAIHIAFKVASGAAFIASPRVGTQAVIRSTYY